MQVGDSCNWNSLCDVHFIYILSYIIIEFSIVMPKDDEKIKDDWIGSVGRAIVRCSSTYVSKGKNKQGGGDNGGGQAGLSSEAYEDDSDDYSNSSNNPYFND